MKGRFRLLLVAVVLVGLATGAFLASQKPSSQAGAAAAGQMRAGAEAVAVKGAVGEAAAGRVDAPAAVKGSTPDAAAPRQAMPDPGLGTPAAVDKEGRGRAQGAGGRFGAVVGTVTSVEGDTLTVSTQQGDVKVKLPGARIQKTVEGTPEDLKSGERVVVSGQPGSDGIYAASSIQIAPLGAMLPVEVTPSPR